MVRQILPFTSQGFLQSMKIMMIVLLLVMSDLLNLSTKILSLSDNILSCSQSTCLLVKANQKFHQKKLIQKNPEQFPKKRDENIRLIPGFRDFDISRPIPSQNEMTRNAGHWSSSLPTPQKKKKCVCEAKSINDGIFFCTSPFLLGSELQI